MYNQRLSELREPTLAAAAAKFGAQYTKTDKVIDLVEGSRSYIVGTLYKTMKLKPSVLDEFKDISETSAPVEPLTDYTHTEDTMGALDRNIFVYFFLAGKSGDA